MKSTLILCILFGVAFDLSTAAAFGERTTHDVAVQKKAERAAGDGGQQNNMTVAFVPLISIIANLLPRFFGRYASAPPSSAQQARSIYIPNKEQPMECQKLEQVGMKLPDQLSLYHYYQCHLSKTCFTVNQESCFQVKRHPCKPHDIFSYKMQKCFPTSFFKKSRLNY